MPRTHQAQAPVYDPEFASRFSVVQYGVKPIAFQRNLDFYLIPAQGVPDARRALRLGQRGAIPGVPVVIQHHLAVELLGGAEPGSVRHRAPAPGDCDPS